MTSPAPRAQAWTSVLFTPGTRPERVEKAWRNGVADVVVMDLEDAVRPDEKDAARDDAVRLLTTVPEAPCLRAVRINLPGTELGDADLDALIPAMPDLVVVPKAEDAQSLQRLADRIEREGGQTRLLAIVESARGVLEAPDIAQSGLAALAFGAEDLAADAGMRRSPDNREVATARGWVALAAAASHVPAIDMITADLQDLERFRREAVEARNLGYQGKMCLHPDQVRTAREAFAATQEELAWARRVMSEAAGGGVAVVDGRMIDAPLLAQARRILQDDRSR